MSLDPIVSPYQFLNLLAHNLNNFECKDTRKLTIVIYDCIGIMRLIYIRNLFIIIVSMQISLNIQYLLRLTNSLDLLKT